MKNKIFFIFLLGLIFCSRKKTIDESNRITYNEIVGTWVSQDTNSHYSSFSFSENKKYILTERESQKQIEGNLKFQDSRIRLNDFGLITIISLSHHKELSFSLLEKNNIRSFYLVKKKR